VVSAVPDPATEPVPLTEMARERDTVRRMEARLAAEHGADTPAYWRAMSETLRDYLADPKFRGVTDRGEDHVRAHGWLTRVAAAYRALAAPGPGVRS
jgi:hypothetical protein